MTIEAPAKTSWVYQKEEMPERIVRFYIKPHGRLTHLTMEEDYITSRISIATTMNKDELKTLSNLILTILDQVTG